MTWQVVGKYDGSGFITSSHVPAEVIDCPEAVPTRIWGAVVSKFFLCASLVKK